MKRFALLLLIAWLAAPLAWCAANPVDDLFKQAKAATAAGKWDDALGLYERVLVEHPEASDRWYGAQQAIATTLASKKDLAQAAKAAHLAQDGAPSAQSFDSAVQLTANILSTLDHSVERANQHLAFQQAGPIAGATNPLDAVGYPSQPERERAFAAMRQQAGDSATGSRLRAYTFLFTGKPREALAQFADAFRRCSNLAALPTAGADLSAMGLRAVRGHRIDQEKALQFVQFGPNGPDGKPNTPDDLADPFAEFLAAPLAEGEGGQAGLSADDLAALRHLLDAAKLYAGDPWVHAEQRRGGLIAMQRANDALDNWGAAGQKEWYLQILFNTEEPNLVDLSLAGAMGAAKGRALHLGGLYALWNEIDAYCAARGIAPHRARDGARSQFNTVSTALTRFPIKKPDFNPLKKPASF